MNHYMLYLNAKRCIGCHGCAIHCKSYKSLPVGPILCEITYEDLKLVRGIPKTEFRFRSCFHCEGPLCVASCPTYAIRKRNDGIVFIDQETCIGCMACAKACPWQVPQFNPTSGKAVKCDYCLDRLDQGLKPACVSRCTTHALKFIRLEER
ncbi:MAG: 4Fe-4S dicluster domain-containing protein [Proteobacteria bacterium]|nr:4Fe-4S dicluster domain-containing protein [Desulfobulbaceae bacterium]MBU4152895.1 4Fe-4S dicluster domain-containing protein [Pseudomonadota bacterium]MDP2107350.1 4Fe-4S dicluster domain-containing protein [Desulfobulbaceae bacterium]